MYLEFVVPGPPVSNQSPGPNLTSWRATVPGEARLRWRKPLLLGELKVIIINFYEGNKPTVDVDNMSKPILDVMQTILYDDDRQVVQAEFAHAKISAAYSIVGVRPIIVDAIRAGNEFVYVRIEDPVYPFPLPR